jgi:hypothetical protein
LKKDHALDQYSLDDLPQHQYTPKIMALN